jgi:integrase/recombinase XerD
MKLETDNLIDDLNRWYKAYIDNITALSFSNNTIELYSRAIDMFIEYSHDYQEDMSISDIKSIFITGYLAYIENQARLNGRKIKNGTYLSKSTKGAYLKGIRNLFSFISDNNDDLRSFDSMFKKIKIVDSSKREEKLVHFSEDEIEKLLYTLEKEKRKKDTYMSMRNSLLIKLLLFSGLRISEALGVTTSAFKEKGEIYTINVYGKGQKEQIAYINKKEIEDEIEYFKSKLEEDQFIMKTESDAPLNRSNAYTIANRIYKKAGVRKTGLHVLRHTLAMRLVKKDTNLLTIKKVLRHSSINSTMVYAKASEGNVTESLTKL